MNKVEPDKARSWRRGGLTAYFLFLSLYWAIVGNQGFDCPSDFLTVTGPCRVTTGVFEYLLWGLLLVFLLLDLRWNRSFGQFLDQCKRFWPVFVFVLWAAISLAWSPVFEVSLSRVIILLISILTAVYLSSQFELRSFAAFLAWALAALSLVCLIDVIFWPGSGIAVSSYYFGAWTGVFWHRNYLGVFMAVALGTYLIRILDWKSLSLPEKVLLPAAFVLSAFLLIKSKSATGLLTAVIAVGVLVLTAVWLRFRQKLKKIHYAVILVVLAAIIIAALLNLDTIFGLLGRNTSLTGRVPMWQYLFQHAINQRLWTGYGYDSVWHMAGFRAGVARGSGWGTQVLIGDNGFIDIWLNLGLVGLVMIAGLLITGLVRAVKYLLSEKTVLSAFPLVLIVYTLIANISLSLMLQSELFFWSVLLISQGLISGSVNTNS